MMTQRNIRNGEIVQVKIRDSFVYAMVVDYIPGNEFRMGQYRVMGLKDIDVPTLTPSPNETWVDSDCVVSYAALRAAFGPIDSIERML